MDYQCLSRIENTIPAPISSHIVIADVRGSTAAILQGKFKEVNLAGAACVAAIRNVFDARRLPYVFGGDGATFLVADEDLETCLYILRGVQIIIQKSLALRLTVGHISMREIREQGADVSVGFLSYSEKEQLPFFRGEGIALAESEIKRMDESLDPHNDAYAANANIAGLSCRLLPFKAVRGRILSIVIQPFGDAKAVDEVLSNLFQTLSRDGPLERFRPISLSNERRPWLSPSWRTEARVLSKGQGEWRFLKAQVHTIFESLLGTFLFRFNIRNSVLGQPSEYTKRMLLQSDWIKMDGCLRLVIDANAMEENEILELLEGSTERKKLIFGLYASDATVMTCHFQSEVGDQHTHFIDGFGGGLTQAAIEMKTKAARELRMLQSESQTVKSSRI